MEEGLKPNKKKKLCRCQEPNFTNTHTLSHQTTAGDNKAFSQKNET